jgi:uncharacterized membrane protein YciS (DUF1049 family)
MKRPLRKEKGERLQTGLFRRSTRMLLALIVAPLYWLEKREREQKLEERLKRLERKQKLLEENKHSSY